MMDRPSDPEMVSLHARHHVCNIILYGGDAIENM
jgi:hypothetical protein